MPDKKFSLIGWLTALMLVLSGGSIWALFGLMHDGVGAMMAIPVAILNRFALSFVGPFSRWLGALHSAWMFVLAFAYAQYFMIAAELSHTMGVEFSSSLNRTGFDLAFATTQLRFDREDWWWLVAGFAFALVLGALAPARKTSASQS